MKTTLDQLKFTRNDYMEQRCAHREYYEQFVTEGVKTLVRDKIGVNQLRASRDEHMNDIALHRWDAMAMSRLFDPESLARLRATDADTLAGRVCILKMAARMILDEVTI